MPADGNTPGAAAARMDLRAKHMQDLTPLMRAQAVKFQRATELAFRQQRSPAGEQWPPLAPSTIKQRISGQDKRHRGRTTGFKALIKTGKLNSELIYRPDAATIKLEAVRYLDPHVTGSKSIPNRPPKRNPLVYDRVNGKLVLVQPYGQQFREAFIRYVETGRAR